MSDPRGAVSDAQVERALRALGADLSFPPTPSLAGPVRVRLGAAGTPDRRGWLRRLIGGRPVSPTLSREPGGRDALGLPVPLRQALVAMAVTVVAAAAILAIFPDARSAVAERLGLRRVSITHVPSVPIDPSRPLGQGLLLGRPSSLGAAQSEVPFPILQPARLGAPDEVYVLGTPSAPYVSLVYRPREGLPPTAPTGVGLLLSQFSGTVPDSGVVSKALPPDARADSVTVGGGRGFWISGAPHGFFYQGPDGMMRSDGARLAGNTLLWERDGITFRLESALPRDQALSIAESLR